MKKSSTKQKNAHLIHIFESEWKKKRNAVKTFLTAKLGIPSTTLNAIDCDIRAVDNDIARDFCINHFRGPIDDSILNLGLYYGNESVSLAVFRKNNNKSNVLSRFVIKPDYKINGALGKLSKMAFQELGPFITYVHKRLNYGNDYNNSGYIVIKNIKPDYWYYKAGSDSGTIFNKRSIGEDMSKDGLGRVYDCDKIKFRYEG